MVRKPRLLLALRLGDLQGGDLPPPFRFSPGYMRRFFALDVATYRIYIIGMRFVWDEKKNKQNIRRHGIDFRDVPDMFERPMLLWLDTRQDYGEDRWIGLGLLRSVVAAVVFVEWEEQDTMRIISARKATTYETKQFYEEITY